MPDASANRMMGVIERMRVPPGSKVNLASDHDPGYKAGWLKKTDGAEYLQLSRELVAEYEDRLAAQRTYGVVVVLQGIDAAGKDGTIRHVMSGVNPQHVTVHSFKVPTEEELDHDYLWRSVKHLPARGQIGVFNRSHYEEVLVVRVHPEQLDAERLPLAARRPGIWRRRYREINDWERYLVENGFRFVKLFLNISREEQRRRFLKRIERPDKNWKFSASDIAERARWEDYQRAFSEMLSNTSTKWAPWWVIPSDHKWFSRISVAAVLANTLIEIDPHYPTVSEEQRRALEAAGAELEAEAPS